MGRQLRRCSTRIDINALAANFDQKRQRFTTDPGSRTLWRARTMHFVLVERHLAKKAIVRRRQHTNFPRSNSPRISYGYRITERSARSFREVDSRGGSNETRRSEEHT